MSKKECKSILPFISIILLYGSYANNCIATEKCSVDESARNVSLKQLLNISWEKLPNVPRGFQCGAAGICEGEFITAGGWCTGELSDSKQKAYIRGFFNDAFAIKLSDPNMGWHKLPDFPGSARMGTSSIAVDEKLYCWGGLNYTAPYCYKDGFCLQKKDKRWVWAELPDLPYPAVFSGICAIKSKIYIFGGSNYKYGVGFFSENDADGNNPHIGAHLLVLDTAKLFDGWKKLKDCPGKARFHCGVAAVSGKIYVMGGCTGSDSKNKKVNTVIDNWCYDPESDQWRRLKDSPICSGNFPSGQIVFENRYILLVGGYQYPFVEHADGRIEKSFGEPRRYYSQWLARYDEPKMRGRPNPYCSDVFVYDTKTDNFGSATMLPFNNNMPKIIVQNNNLYLISGETGGAVLRGEYYGHHPDFFIKGVITKHIESGIIGSTK